MELIFETSIGDQQKITNWFQPANTTEHRPGGNISTNNLEIKSSLSSEEGSSHYLNRPAERHQVGHRAPETIGFNRFNTEPGWWLASKKLETDDAHFLHYLMLLLINLMKRCHIAV